MNEYKDKVVVITGGSGVLLLPVSLDFAQKGAKVAILGINSEELNNAIDYLNQAGYDNVYAIEANVLDKSSLESAKAKINQQFGSVDILINGAGGNHPLGTTDDEQFNLSNLHNQDFKTFFDLDAEGFKFVIDLNFIGTLLPTQVFATDMLEKTHASIINVSSMNAFTPLTKIPAYSGAKAAISNFTAWLAVHFATTNIRVNAIAPGFFLTKQNRELLTNNDGSLTARSEKILRNTPMNRFGDKAEIIGAIDFLCSNKRASFITGIVLPIDGGFSAYSGV